MSNETTYIASYLREKKTRRPIGLLVAVKNEKGVVSFGASLCQKGDEFCKKTALNMARGRAMSNTPQAIPHSFRRFFTNDNFMTRCTKYFKTQEIRNPEFSGTSVIQPESRG